MGRWAYGDEIACASGGCRNLAVWLIADGRRERRATARRTQPACWLHVRSAAKLLTERGLMVDPELLPLEDPTRSAPRKRKRSG